MHLLSPKGFRAAAVAAGIKSSGNLDVAVLACNAPRAASAAAVFTTNKVVAAPVVDSISGNTLGIVLGFVRSSQLSDVAAPVPGLPWVPAYLRKRHRSNPTTAQCS